MQNHLEMEIRNVHPSNQLTMKTKNTDVVTPNNPIGLSVITLSYEMGKGKSVKFIYAQQLQLENQSNKSFTGQRLVDLENHFISSRTKFCLTFQSKARKAVVRPHFY